MNNLKFNYDAAEQYLTLLNDNKPIDEIKWQFSFFEENKGGMKGGAFKTLKDAWPMIINKNNSGCGIFVTVNKTDQPAKNGKSKNGDITGIRAVWRDVDKAPSRNPELMPTFKVITSGGKWHDYWIVGSDEIDFQEWDSVMSIMASEYGADKSAIDLSRVLRLPGTYHLKNEPVLVELKTGCRKSPFTWEEIKKAIALVPSKNIVEQIPEEKDEIKKGYPTLLPDEIEAMLVVIPCEDLEQKEWWRLTVSILRCGDSLTGKCKENVFELWDKWSQTGINYNKDENLKIWKDVKGKYLDITEGTLRWYAEKYKWRPSKVRVLIERYIFCQDKPGTFYDTYNGMVLTKDVFIESNLDNFPGGKNTPKANVVFQRHSQKRTVQGYAWLPLPHGEEEELIFEHDKKLYINEWNGFAIAPVVGDISSWLELVKFLIPDEEEREVVFDWMAFTVQHPDKKINFQILHMGQEGVGKDVMYSPLAIIFGDSAEDIDHEKAVSQYEDSWAENKFVTIQEIYKPGDKKFLNALKAKAASTSTGMVRLNIKCQHQVLQPNLVSFVAMSNYEDCVILTETERRYFVVKSFFHPKEGFDYEYLADKWMREGKGASYIFHFLLQRNLSMFDPGKLPLKTKAFYELVKDSRPEFELIIEEWEEMKHSVFNNELICIAEVRRLLFKAGKRNVSNKGIANALNNIGRIKLKKRGQKKVDGKSKKTPYLYSNNPEKYNKLSASELYALWEKRPMFDVDEW